MFGLLKRDRSGFVGTSTRLGRARGSARLSLERLEDRSMLGGSGLGPSTGGHEVTVMSQNLYLGAAIEPVIVAAMTGEVEDLICAVSVVWQGVNATNFPERAEKIADQIDASDPDFIGLQEVSLYRTGPADSLTPDPTPAEDVVYDFLNILLDKLEERGLSYTPVAVTVETDVEFPAMVGPDVYQDVRMTDRDVILARTDLPRSQMKISHVQEERFDTNLYFTVGATGETVTVWRGWNSVDVKVGHAKFRFINTHLEAESAEVQYAQARELLAGPAATALPTVMVGDFNSPANRPDSWTYQLLVGAGFADTWSETNPGDLGYTFGNDPDLLNPDPLTLDPQRIDLVLHGGPVLAVSMDIVNDEPGDRTDTIPPLWPSDHAGVVATLGVPAWPFRLPFFAIGDDGVVTATKWQNSPGPQLPEASSPIAAARFQETPVAASPVDGGITATWHETLPSEDSLDLLVSSRGARPGLKVRDVVFAAAEPEEFRYELR